MKVIRRILITIGAILIYLAIAGMHIDYTKGSEYELLARSQDMQMLPGEVFEYSLASIKEVNVCVGFVCIALGMFFSVWRKGAGKVFCVTGILVMLAGIIAMIYVAQSGYGDDWVNLAFEFGKELGYTQELSLVDNVWYHILMYRVQLAIGGAVAAVIGYLVAIWDRLNINIHIEKKGN